MINSKNERVPTALSMPLVRAYLKFAELNEITEEKLNSLYYLFKSESGKNPSSEEKNLNATIALRDNSENNDNEELRNALGSFLNSEFTIKMSHFLAAHEMYKVHLICKEIGKGSMYVKKCDETSKFKHGIFYDYNENFKPFELSEVLNIRNLTHDRKVEFFRSVNEGKMEFIGSIENFKCSHIESWEKKCKEIFPEDSLILKSYKFLNEYCKLNILKDTIKNR